MSTQDIPVDYGTVLTPRPGRRTVAGTVAPEARATGGLLDDLRAGWAGLRGDLADLTANVRAGALDGASSIGRSIGMPGRDVLVLAAGLVAVLVAFFAAAGLAEAYRADDHVTPLEAQRQEWLATQEDANADG